MAELRSMARWPLAFAGACALALVGCGESDGASGLERAGWRVDDREMADGCLVDEQRFCTGSGYPLALVDPARRRIVVAWIGSYEPNRDEVFVRELARNGKPLGEPRLLGAVDDPGAHLRLTRSAAGYALSWDRRTRVYAPSFKLLRTRKGVLRLRGDPNITEGRYGSPLAHVPGGRPVLLYRTMDWQIRAIPRDSL